MLVLCAGLAAACPPASSAPSQPLKPLDPVLDAVLRPGPWLQFARHMGNFYEVLPSASAILRMASAYDASTTNITLKNLIGGRPVALEQVARDALLRKRDLANQGYFEVVVDSHGYSVIVTPPADQRTGPGFDLVMVNSRSAGALPPGCSS
ncbi:MAG TPA: hypothetical protein VHN14_30425 [Kofleriaceae bacterium]|nr:hypothetical protein [Kofleriaceae bacterium]